MDKARHASQPVAIFFLLHCCKGAIKRLLRFADHVERSGIQLFERVCKLDLEGIVAKYKFGPYGGQDTLSTWYKIRNRGYSQMVGRNELFERDRHREPTPGWHACELVCDDAA